MYIAFLIVSLILAVIAAFPKVTTPVSLFPLSFAFFVAANLIRIGAL